jgi:hypothetical protein
MEEGIWIDMAGIPLIATEGATAEDGAAGDAEGGGAEAGHSGDAEQGAKVARDKRVERTVPAKENPASDAEHLAVAERAELATGTSPKADASNAEGATHVSVEQTGEAAHGSSGGVTP